MKPIINLSQLTQPELVELIQNASAELATRMATPAIERIKHHRLVVSMREPPEEDKDFMLMLKAELARGGYIKAQDRHRAAGIAREFPEWARHQQMPSGGGAGEWRRAGEVHSAPRAMER